MPHHYPYIASTITSNTRTTFGGIVISNILDYYHILNEDAKHENQIIQTVLSLGWLHFYMEAYVKLMSE